MEKTANLKVFQSESCKIWKGKETNLQVAPCHCHLGKYPIPLLVTELEFSRIISFVTGL